MLISDYSGATISPCGYEVINHDLNNEEKVPTVEEEVNILLVSTKAKANVVISFQCKENLITYIFG